MIPVDKQKLLKVSVDNNFYKPKTGRTVTDLKMSTNPFDLRNPLTPGRQLHVTTVPQNRENAVQIAMMPQQPYFQNMAAMSHAAYQQSTYQMQQLQYMALQQQQMSSQHQQMSSHSMMIPNKPSPTLDPPAVPSFKTTALPVGSIHDVVVTYIEDGPTLFSIQLKHLEKDLDALMTSLSAVKLRALDSVNFPPTIGQACIARFSQDHKLYRAVIMSKSTNTYTVAYVDYGNSETVRVENIFEIPQKFLNKQVFAMSFSLANVRQLGGVITDDIKKKFSEVVQGRILRMQVTPWEGPIVQYCDLYDGPMNILEAMVEYRSIKNSHYLPALVLNKNSSQQVYVCYIHSAKQFYVQLIAHAQAFEEMIDHLELHCESSPCLTEVKPGIALAAKYEDGSWYRAQVHQVLTNQVMVQFIDFGNYERIAIKDLRLVHSQYMEIPPQAIQCCLHGFEQVENESDTTRTQFELMVQNIEGNRKELKLHVVDIIRDTLLVVELFDENLSPPLDITKRIYKLSMPQNKYNSIANIQHGGDRNDRTPPAMNSTENEMHGSTTMWDNQITLKDSDSNQTIGSDGGKHSSTHDGSRPSSERNVHQVQSSNYNQQKIDSSRESGTFSQAQSESDTSTNIQASPPQMMPFETKFEEPVVKLNSKSTVLLSEWCSPHEFYIQKKDNIREFEAMMQRIQTVYKTATTSPDLPAVGSNVIAKFSGDRLLYRATLIDYNAALRKFKVKFVDFGNKAIVNEKDVFPVAKEFFKFPMLAIRCSLNRIISCRDWTELKNNLDKYLDRENKNVECEFLHFANGVGVANVTILNKDLKRRLIDDKYVLDLPQDINLKVLTGQILLLKIGEIKHLFHFFAKLDGYDFYWPCSYFDAMRIQHVDPGMSFKDKYHNKTCVAKIGEVTDTNILSISLAIFDDFVAPLYCSVPCFSQKINVTVEHIESYDRIYVRPVACKDQMAKLLDDMYDFYESQDAPIQDFQQDCICACLSLDANWYRAQIIKLHDNQHVEIKCIDYGNHTVLPLTNLRVLVDQFRNLSACVLKVYSSICCAARVIEEDVKNEISTLISDYEMTLELLQPYKNVWVGELSYNGIGLDRILADKKMIRKLELADVLAKIEEHEESMYKATAQQDPEIVPETTIETSSEIDPSVDFGHLETGFLCHVDDPERFYINLKDDMEELEKMSTNLQIVAPSLPPLSNYDVGTACIAKCSVKNTWYRAKIICNDPDMITLQFIDYGNKDVIVDDETGKMLLKENTEISSKADGFAIACALLVKPVIPQNSEEWNEPACEILRSLVNKEIQFELITKTPTKCFVNLYHELENITKKLVDEHMAIAIKPILSGSDCYISHTNSLSEFFIQLESDSNGLEVMGEFLLNDERFPFLENVQNGQVCVAQFPDDSSFYRAFIQDHSESEATVTYIDYGNHATIPRCLLKDLPVDFTEIPPFAYRCALRMPTNILKWSEAAELKFNELAGDGETVFKIELIEPRDFHTLNIVNLYMNGENIVQQLEDLCEKIPQNEFEKTIKTIQKEMKNCLQGSVNVTMFITPMDFYVQYKASVDTLQKIVDLLAQPDLKTTEPPAVDEICGAKYTEDGLFYRAIVLSISGDERLVRFIDYGNTATATEFVKLPENLKKIEPFVIHCQIEAPPTCGLSEFFKTEFEKLVFADAADFDFEIIDGSAEPMLVKLTQNQINITDLLPAETTQSTTPDTTEVAPNNINEEKPAEDNRNATSVSCDTGMANLRDTKMYHKNTWKSNECVLKELKKCAKIRAPPTDLRTSFVHPSEPMSKK